MILVVVRRRLHDAPRLFFCVGCSFPTKTAFGGRIVVHRRNSFRVVVRCRDYQVGFVNGCSLHAAQEPTIRLLLFGVRGQVPKGACTSGPCPENSVSLCKFALRRSGERRVHGARPKPWDCSSPEFATRYSASSADYGLF
jgi:hypothetical protein